MSAKYIFLFIFTLNNRIFDKQVFSKLNGSFEDTNASEKLYEDTVKHPVVLFSLGSKFQREQFLNHPEVESLLYVQKGKLYQMFLPHTIQEFDEETDIPTSKVTGVLGKNIDKYSVLSFTRKEIFGDFWTYLNKSSKLYFASGLHLTEEVFKKTHYPQTLGATMSSVLTE